MKQSKLILFFLLIFSLKSKAQPGTLDPSFGNSGIVLTSFNDGNAGLAKQVIQKDGKILVVGYSKGGVVFCTMVRYMPDGLVDSSFGENGRVVFNGFFASSLALQSDGKIVVVGDANDIVLLRFLTNGEIDSTFGVNGTVIGTLGGSDLAIQPDGKIVITGGYTNEFFNSNAFVARYNADGTIDETFGNNGVIILANIDSDVTSIQLQKDDKIVIAGNNDFLNTTDLMFFLARFNENGQLDETFGNNGWEYSDFDIGGESIQDIALQPDGKIVVAGYAKEGFGLTQYMAVARYKLDGTLDESFGEGGKAKVVFNAYSKADGIALQQNGKIVIAGVVSNHDGNFAVSRLLNNGLIDSVFGTEGYVITDLGTLADQAFDVSIQQKDGKIIAGGRTLTSIALTRYFGDPVNPHPIITKIKKWIKNHILNFQDTNPNTEYYVIEKSNTATGGFAQVAKIDAKAANTTYNYSLAATDNLQAANNYYRIKAVNKDNSFTYSSVISSSDDAAVVASSLKIFPNPVKDKINISSAKEVNVRLQNSYGQIILTQKIKGNGSIDVSKVPVGIYYIIDGDSGASFKVVKE